MGFLEVDTLGLLIWDGTRWRKYEGGQGQKIAESQIRRVLLREYNEAVEAGDKNRADELNKLCRPRGYAEVLAEVTRARARTEFPQADELDADPFLFNTPDGVLDLRRTYETGETATVLSHDGTLYITKRAGASYLGDDAAIDGTVWQRFLDFVQPDRDVQRTMAQHAGCGLVGRVLEQRAVFHRNVAGGKAENGKSAYHLILGSAFGDYAWTAPESLFIGRTNEFAVAHARGVRWMEIGELPSDGAWNERMFKAIVGGDELTAAFKHKGHFSFRSMATVSVHTNHPPRLRGGDAGTERRTVCVPWEREISETQKPKVRRMVDHILEKELGVVLTWMVRGLADFATDKTLFLPESVERASYDLTHEYDPVHEWLADETEPDPHAVVYVSDLRDRYNAWARINGRPDLSPGSFSNHLTTNQVAKTTPGKHGQRRQGIRVKGA
ncbi:DNA primase family protein [Gordonia sp. NPDC003376]